MGFKTIGDIPRRSHLSGVDMRSGWRRVAPGMAYYHIHGKWKASVILANREFVVQVIFSNHTTKVDTLEKAMLLAEALVALTD